VNNSVFKCFLKVGREPLNLSWAGNMFHTVGAATEKARLPRERERERERERSYCVLGT